MNVPHASWCITAAPDTTAPGCDFVRQWLREHNWAVNPAFMHQWQQPEHAARPRISIMSVHPEWRSKGIGTALLAEAERLAIERGCKHAYVDTMDYQAPQFYLSHGFKIVGQIPDWDSHGHSKIYFFKSV